MGKLQQLDERIMATIKGTMFLCALSLPGIAVLCAIVLYREISPWLIVVLAWVLTSLSNVLVSTAFFNRK